MSDIKNSLEFGSNPKEHFFSLNKEILSGDAIVKENADSTKKEYHFVHRWEADPSWKVFLRRVKRIFLAIISFGIVHLIHHIKSKGQSQAKAVSGNDYTTITNIAKQALFLGRNEISVGDFDTKINVKAGKVASVNITSKEGYNFDVDEVENTLSGYLQQIISEKKQKIQDYLQQNCNEAYEELFDACSFDVDFDYESKQFLCECRLTSSRVFSSTQKIETLDDINIDSIALKLQEFLKEELVFNQKCKRFSEIACYSVVFDTDISLENGEVCTLSTSQSNNACTYCFGKDEANSSGLRFEVSTEGKITISEKNEVADKILDAFVKNREEKIYEEITQPKLTQIMQEGESFTQPFTFTSGGKEVTYSAKVGEDALINEIEFSVDDEIVVHIKNGNLEKGSTNEQMLYIDMAHITLVQSKLELKERLENIKEQIKSHLQDSCSEAFEELFADEVFTVEFNESSKQLATKFKRSTTQEFSKTENIEKIQDLNVEALAESFKRFLETEYAFIKVCKKIKEMDRTWTYYKGPIVLENGERYDFFSDSGFEKTVIAKTNPCTSILEFSESAEGVLDISVRKETTEKLLVILDEVMKRREEEDRKREFYDNAVTLSSAVPLLDYPLTFMHNDRVVSFACNDVEIDDFGGRLEVYLDDDLVIQFKDSTLLKGSHTENGALMNKAMDEIEKFKAVISTFKRNIRGFFSISELYKNVDSFELEIDSNSTDIAVGFKKLESTEGHEAEFLCEYGDKEILFTTSKLIRGSIVDASVILQKMNAEILKRKAQEIQEGVLESVEEQYHANFDRVSIEFDQSKQWPNVMVTYSINQIPQQEGLSYLGLSGLNKLQSTIIEKLANVGSLKQHCDTICEIYKVVANHHNLIKVNIDGIEYGCRFSRFSQIPGGNCSFFEYDLSKSQGNQERFLGTINFTSLNRINDFDSLLKNGSKSLHKAIVAISSRKDEVLFKSQVKALCTRIAENETSDFYFYSEGKKVDCSPSYKINGDLQSLIFTIPSEDRDLFITNEALVSGNSSEANVYLGIVSDYLQEIEEHGKELKSRLGVLSLVSPLVGEGKMIDEVSVFYSETDGAEQIAKYKISSSQVTHNGREVAKIIFAYEEEGKKDVLEFFDNSYKGNSIHTAVKILRQLEVIVLASLSLQVTSHLKEKDPHLCDQYLQRIDFSTDVQTSIGYVQSDAIKYTLCMASPHICSDDFTASSPLTKESIEEIQTTIYDYLIHRKSIAEREGRFIKLFELLTKEGPKRLDISCGGKSYFCIAKENVSGGASYSFFAREKPDARSPYHTHYDAWWYASFSYTKPSFEDIDITYRNESQYMNVLDACLGSQAELLDQLDCKKHFTELIQLAGAARLPSTFMYNDQEVSYNPIFAPLSFKEISGEDGLSKSLIMIGVTFAYGDKEVVFNNDIIKEGDLSEKKLFLEAAVKHIRSLHEGKEGEELQGISKYLVPLLQVLNEKETFVSLEQINPAYAGQTLIYERIEEEDTRDIVCTFTLSDQTFTVRNFRLESGSSADFYSLLGDLDTFMIKELKAKEQLSSSVEAYEGLRTFAAEGFQTLLQFEGSSSPCKISALKEESEEGDCNYRLAIEGREEILIEDGVAPRGKNLLAVEILQKLTWNLQNTLKSLINGSDVIELISKELQERLDGGEEDPTWDIGACTFACTKIDDQVIFTIRRQDEDKTSFHAEYVMSEEEMALTVAYADRQSFINSIQERIEEILTLDYNTRNAVFSQNRSDFVLSIVDYNQKRTGKYINVCAMNDERSVQIDLLPSIDSDQSERRSFILKRIGGHIVFSSKDREEVSFAQRSEILFTLNTQQVHCNISQIYRFGSLETIINTPDIAKAAIMHYEKIMEKMGYTIMSIEGTEGTDAGGLRRDMITALASESLCRLPRSKDDGDRLVGNFMLSKYSEPGTIKEESRRQLERLSYLGKLCQVAFMQHSIQNISGNRCPVGQIFTDKFFEVVKTISAEDLKQEKDSPLLFLKAKSFIMDQLFTKTDLQGHFIEESLNFLIATHTYLEAKKLFDDLGSTTNVAKQRDYLTQFMTNQIFWNVLERWIVEGEHNDIEKQQVFIKKLKDEQKTSLQKLLENEFFREYFEDWVEDHDTGVPESENKAQKTLNYITFAEENSDDFNGFVDYWVDGYVGKFVHPIVAIVKGMTHLSASSTASYAITLSKLCSDDFPGLLQGEFDRTTIKDAICYYEKRKYLKNEYTDKKIVWIKEFIENGDEEEVKKFLQFATGARTIAPDAKIEIDPINTTDSRSNYAPAAHTCFNRVDIRNNWMIEQSIARLEKDKKILPLSECKTQEQRDDRAQTIEECYKIEFMQIFRDTINTVTGYSKE